MNGTASAQPPRPDDTQRRRPHWIVGTNHRMRALSFANAFAFCGLQLWAMGWPAWSWVLLALQFLVYPHLVYWRARRAADTQQAELQNLLLDCLLLGLWVGSMGFPLWITFTLFISTTINNAINQATRAWPWPSPCSLWAPPWAASPAATPGNPSTAAGSPRCAPRA